MATELEFEDNATENVKADALNEAFNATLDPPSELERNPSAESVPTKVNDGFDQYAKQREQSHTTRARLEKTFVKVPDLEELEDAPEPAPGPEPQKQEDSTSRGELLRQMVIVPPKLALGMAADAIGGVANAGIDFINWASDQIRDRPAIGFTEDGDLRLDVSPFGLNTKIVREFDIDIGEKLVSQEESTALQITRDIGSWLAPYTLASKLAKGTKLLSGAGAASSFARGSVAGAVADVLSVDPDGGLLKNLTTKYPDFAPFLTEYFNDPDDTRAEKRLKNALEGILLGGPVELGFMALAKVYRGVKGTLGFSDEALKEVPVKAGVVAEPKGIRVKQTEDTISIKNLDTGQDEVLQKVKTAKLAPVQKQVEAGTVSSKKLNSAFKTYNVKRSTTPASKQAHDIISKAKNVKAITKGVNQLSISINAKGSPEAFKAEFNTFAERLGTTTENLQFSMAADIPTLSTIRAMDAMIDASEERLIGGAIQALDDKSDEALLYYMEEFQRHTDIVKNIEAPRSKPNKVIQSTQESMKNLSELGRIRSMDDQLAMYGGRVEIEDLVRKTLEGVSLQGRSSVNALARISAGRTRNSTLLSWRANNLLSLRSLFVNPASNAYAMASNIGENFFREAAPATLRQASSNLSPDAAKVASDVAPFNETQAMLSGTIGAIVDAFRLRGKARQQLLESGQIGDAATIKLFGTQATKIDLPGVNPISAEALASKGSFGRALDYMANTPFRLLGVQDDFFKAVNYKAGIHEGAARIGAQKGLTPRGIKNLINNPDEALQDYAANLALKATYTKPLEGLAKSVDTLIKTRANGYLSFQPMRLIFPFTKSLFNVTEHMVARTPVLGSLIKENRVAMQAGGVAREKAIARMAHGSTLLAAGSYLAANGIIVGRGPADPKMNKVWRENGGLPYSINLPGGVQIQYDFLDGLGGFLGMAADSVSLMGSFYNNEDGSEKDADEFAAAMTLLVSSGRFVTPDFIEEGLAQILNIIAEEDKQFSQKIKSFAAQITVTSTVPLGGFINSLRKGVDPIKREVRSDEKGLQGAFDELLNTYANRTPWLSKTLGARVNDFGDPVMWTDGFNDNITSPFFASFLPVIDQKQKQTVVDEMVRLGMTDPISIVEPDPNNRHLTVSPMRRSITLGGVTVKLDHKEINEMKKLSAGIGVENKPFDMTLHEKLNDEISSGYPTLPIVNDANKIDIIQAIIREYRRNGKAEYMKKHPEVIEQMRDLAEKKQDIRLTEE